MSISEQVKKLREFGKNRKLYVFSYNDVNSVLSQAADTIEFLSAKLQAANEELKRWHTDHVNEKIKNPFAYTSTLICHNCDHKDEYIEELEAEVEELKAVNMERSAEDCGGWIPCENKPQRKRDESSRPVLVRYKDETANPDVCNYNFLTGKFVFIEKDVTKYVKEWREIPGYEP